MHVLFVEDTYIHMRRQLRSFARAQKERFSKNRNKCASVCRTTEETKAIYGDEDKKVSEIETEDGKFRSRGMKTSCGL